MPYSSDMIQLFVNGLDHPEGVAVGQDGMVYAGGESGQVYRIPENGAKVEEFSNTGGFCLGLALDQSDRIFICDMKRQAVMVVEKNGRCEVFADAVGGKRFKMPNFAVFDRHGNLYVSDSGDWKKGNGLIYRISLQGQAEIFHNGPFHYTNGLALDAGEDYLYVVESNLNRVVRIAIQKDGRAGGTEVFADGIYNVPDGMAFDAPGNLYVTCFANDCIFVIDRHGTKEMLCRDEDSYILNQPTNCAFGGPDLKLMLISNLGADHLAALKLTAAGQPLFNRRIQRQV